jgi:hypothetical protein
MSKYYYLLLCGLLGSSMAVTLVAEEIEELDTSVNQIQDLDSDGTSSVPVELLQKLESDDLTNYLITHERIIASKKPKSLYDVVLEFTIPLMFVGIAGFIAWVLNRRRQDILGSIGQYVEHGKDVPQELLNAIGGRRGKGTFSNLRFGLILVALGVALGIVLMITEGPGESSIGLIPLLVGVAYLVVWRVEQNENTAMLNS